MPQFSAVGMRRWCLLPVAAASYCGWIAPFLCPAALCCPCDGDVLKNWAAQEGCLGPCPGGMEPGIAPAFLSCFSSPVSPKGHGRPGQELSNAFSVGHKQQHVFCVSVRKLITSEKHHSFLRWGWQWFCETGLRRGEMSEHHVWVPNGKGKSRSAQALALSPHLHLRTFL